MVQKSSLIPVRLVDCPVIETREHNGWDGWLVGLRPCLPWFHLVFLVFFLLFFLVPPYLPEPSPTAQPWNDLRVMANYLI